jgi:hypothetical protein
MPWLVLPDQASGCGGADDPIHFHLFQCPEVGPIRDQVRGELMVAAVPGQERHVDAINGTDGQGRRRFAIRRLDVDLPGVLEKLIETCPADDSDHELSLSELIDGEPPDVLSSDLELVDFVSSDLELLDLELLDLEVVDLDLLDLESVT